MVNAGRVLIIPQGDWSSLEPYQMLDLVTYDKTAYLARKASVGVNPQTDVQKVYWQPFGTAVEIATTEKPGIVMPDGTTITISQAGVIEAHLILGEAEDVDIVNPQNGQVLSYSSILEAWQNKSLGTAASKNSTSSITSGSTDLIESGAVHSLKQTLESEIGDLTDLDTTVKTDLVSAVNEVKASAGGALYFSGQACSALTGNFCTISNANITANHVVAEVVFANPSAITTDVTWTTASGSLKLNGTCSTATTVNIVLVKKNN